jgi:hypothetical protein
MKALKLFQLALSLSLALTGSAFAAEAHTMLPANDSTEKSAAKFTPGQLAEMQARVDLANTIVKNVEADATAKGAADSWRIGLLSSLYNAPSASLRNIAASATTLDQAHALASTAVTQAQGAATLAKNLGSSIDNLVYTPKAPCRFIDTRNVGGPITTPRNFDTWDIGSTYGGDPTCTLPSIGEPGFVANVTIVVPAGNPGFIGIRPFGNTAVTSFINWEASGTTGLANAGVVTTALNGLSHYAFNVFAGGGNSPQFILDYIGYFSGAAAVALDCVNVIGDVTVPGFSSSYYSPPVGCSSGYSPVSAYCWNHNNSNVYVGASGINPTAFCGWINNSASSAIVSQGTTCCRVP